MHGASRTGAVLCGLVLAATLFGCGGGAKGLDVVLSNGSSTSVYMKVQYESWSYEQRLEAGETRDLFVEADRLFQGQLSVQAGVGLGTDVSAVCDVTDANGGLMDLEASYVGSEILCVTRSQS